MKLTQKETNILNDLKAQEQLCVEKYEKYSSNADDESLRQVFTEIGKMEKQHLNTINKILKGSVPNINTEGQDSKQKKKSGKIQTNAVSGQYNKNDCYLCSDALASEKHVSSTYNTGIFEFKDPKIRQVLNHIQKEEQQHGEKIFDYMAATGMYPTE